jgi:hypothetical protein
MAEFGKRRTEAEPAASRATATSSGLNFRMPDVEPMQIVYGAGFVLLGYVLGMLLLNTLFPFRAPEFKKFVFVPAELRDDLIKEEFKSVRPNASSPTQRNTPAP